MFRKWTSDSDVATDARLALKTWKRSLPPELRLENVSAASSSYRATFHLHLNYYFALIAMGKYSIVAEVRAHLRRTLGGATTTCTAELRSSQLSVACVKAAKKMLRLFENICKTGNMTKSSFTDFQGCSIATMVLLIAGIVERDFCYETEVRFGLNCLRSMAGEHLTATTGVAFMEALQSIADEAAEKLRNFKMASRVAISPQGQTVSSTECINSISRHFASTEGTNDAQPWSSTQVDSVLPGTAMAFGHTATSTHGTSQHSAQHQGINATWGQQMTPMWAPDAAPAGDPFSLFQFDNEAFLMELTGFDTLGIPGS